ncbi:MAG: TrkA C-terminal domain-containing protein [Phycisphaerales bacterium]
MLATLPILALTIIAAVSFIIVRVGATALRLTGLAPDTASFQAISGFFGVGFTTREAEMIVGHPTRRRIMTHIIIAGNLGITSALATLIVAIMQAESPDASVGVTLSIIAACLGVVLLITRSRAVTRVLDRVIAWSLEHSGAVRALDYETLLRAQDGYVVSEYEIGPGHPLVGRTLRGVGLRQQGVLVLGITDTEGRYTGSPEPDAVFSVGDVLTVYGKERTLHDELDRPTLPPL